MTSGAPEHIWRHGAYMGFTGTHLKLVNNMGHRGAPLESQGTQGALGDTR